MNEGEQIRHQSDVIILNERRAIRWTQRLNAKVQAVLEAHLGPDPDNVRHTLILLKTPVWNGRNLASYVAALTITESKRRFLRALLRRKVRFMIVGLSAAALQGAPVVTHDVDLWFEDVAIPRANRSE